MSRIVFAGANLIAFGDVLLLRIDIELGGVAVGGGASAGVGSDSQGHLIDALVVVDVCDGVLGAGGAVAEVPQEVVFREVDFNGKDHRLFDAVLETLVGLHHLIVEGQVGTQVDGVGAYQIGIALGIAKTVHMGVETVFARDVVHAVADVHSRVTVVVVAVDTVERQRRNLLVVEIHMGNIFRVDDDVDAVYLDVDVDMVESGEGHLVNPLLDGGNPHHRGIAEASQPTLVVTGIVEKVDG